MISVWPTKLCGILPLEKKEFAGTNIMISGFVKEKIHQNTQK